MKIRLTVFTLIFAMGLYMIAPLGAASAQTANTLKNIPVTGSSAGNQVFNGTLSVSQFTHKGNQLLANGTLRGTLTKPDGTTGEVNQQISMPVNLNSGTCQILNLTLGPLDLNLLGLRVQLDQVNLDITAEQGSGNLLGNLLCQVAKILDGPGRAVGRLVSLLNEILSALG